MTQGFVDTRHGCIHYYEEGTGKPLILLHSNGASAHQYDDCMAGFAKQWRVISWDMPGTAIPIRSPSITRSRNTPMAWWR